jgi:hypothetical protein
MNPRETGFASVSTGRIGPIVARIELARRPAENPMRQHRCPSLSARASALLLLLGSCAVHAAETCVIDAAQLQVAFFLGSIQSQPYTIKMMQGTYALSGATDVDFSAPTTLLGGYTTASCTSRVVNPDNTVIDIGGGASKLSMTQRTGSPRAALSLDGLTIAEGATLSLAAGQYNPYVSNDPGDVTVTRSHFRHLGLGPAEYPTQAPVQIEADTGHVRLENALIESISMANSFDCSVEIWLDDDSHASLNYVTANLSSAHDFCIREGKTSGNYQVDVHNSIVWASDGTLSTIRGRDGFGNGYPFAVNINSSILHAYTGIGSVGTSNNLNTSPLWSDPANANYHLQAASPAVNSGNLVDPLGLPGTDIAGGARWVGSRPDRGAYESAVNDLSGFVVTSTADSGGGTLRQAILDANSSINPATISFNIAGACPRVIGLSSALPHVTSPIIIDGYTQPGAAVNTDPDASDATLCVLVKPASGTLANAIQVPAAGSASASLVLRGVGFGGFGQPVMLLGGSNHVIAGNQFGGSVGSVALPGASLQAIAIGVNAGGSLVVGGQNIADRNVIGGGGFYGINVQTTVASTPDKCRIVNNLIGVAANGVTPVPNFTGIGLGGGGCTVASNRIVGNSQDAILINGGNGNLIQDNVLGVDVNGNGIFNSGAGVHITSGGGNVVGTSASSGITGLLFSNTIRFMVDGGVVATGGTGNSIRSNLIYDNGATGGGMDIDLGVAGPTANDPGDVDTGPNQLQNFPLINGVVFASPPAPSATYVAATVKGVLDGPPGNYRVDAYFGNGCNANGRGHAQAYAGARLVTVAVGATRASFVVNVTLPNVQGDGMLALAATDAAGNTSEIGPCVPLDAIFRDGYE